MALPFAKFLALSFAGRASPLSKARMQLEDAEDESELIHAELEELGDSDVEEV